MKFETLDELVRRRRGYKYLLKDRTSPYQKYKYVFRKGKVFKTDLDMSSNGCGAGWNLATLGWILGDDRHLLDHIIVEFSIPEGARIVVPPNSAGKFRADIIKYEKMYKPADLFPEVEEICKRLEKYKFTSPITAEKLPPENKLLKILDQVGAQVGTQVWGQVGAQVGAQVWAQVGDQVGAQVGAQVWDRAWGRVGAQVWTQVWGRVWAQLWAQVGDQIWAQVWAQVRAQVGAQVRAQVRHQLWVVAYFAAKEFLSLDYEHPAFDLIRHFGVLVVITGGKVKVFGKGGKFLGEYVTEQLKEGT